MTLEYYLANQEMFQTILYNRSLTPLLISIGFVLLFFALSMFGAFRNYKGPERTERIFIFSAASALFLFLFSLEIIQTKDLRWSMNNTHLILYDKAIPEIKGAWEWKTLNIRLFESCDEEDSCFYIIDLTDEKKERITFFKSCSLKSLAKQIYPFSTYYPDFLNQIQENSSLEKREMDQFLRTLTKLSD